jgi:Zn-dependent protease
MKQSFRLFNFQGTPVTLSIWFFLFFLLLPAVAVVAVFVSILIHELAHAWMANQKGYQVYGISIDMIYGSTSIDSNMHDRDLISITAAGPISTLILCIVSYFLEPIIPSQFITYMFNINLFLFLFNILPIYPMDGGQIVRSYANLSSNRYRNRKLANWLSLTFSVLILVYAFYSLNIFMILFGVYFSYITLKELEYIK